MLSASLAFVALRHFGSRSSRGMEMLLDATRSGGVHAGGARLSAEFSYQEPERITRGALSSAETASLQLMEASALIARLQPTSENQHALGVSQLLLGRVNEAVDLLQKAARNPSAVPEAGNDLAAAYLARAVRGESAGEDYAAAYEVLARLVLRDGSKDPAILFNRALALEGLENRTAAQRAWKDYLQVDQSSEWADRARSRLAALRPPATFPPILPSSAESVCGDPLASRRFAENTLLPRWAEATLKGDGPLVAGALREIEQIAEARTACSEDGSVREIAAALRSLSGNGVRSAANAILTLQSVNLRARREQGRDVGAAYERAMADARLTGLPLDRLAAGLCAFQYYYAGDYAAAKRILDGAPRDESRFPAWTAQVYWAEGLLQAVQGSPSQSLELFQKTLRLFEGAREPRNIAAVNMLIAENLTVLDDRKQSWSYRLRALSALARCNDPSRLFYALNEAAEAALIADRPFVALAYQESAGVLAAASEDASERAYHAVWLAMIQDRCAQPRAAADSIQVARNAVTQIATDDVRRRVLADVDLADGFLQQTSDPPRALASWSSALGYFRSLGAHYRAAQLLLARGKGYGRAGDIDRARADFEAGIEELEQQRQRVSDEDLRTSFFGRGAELFDELISLFANLGDASRSYDVAERRRERTLFDAFEGIIRGITATSASVMQVLEEKEVLLEYAVLEDAVIRWEVRRDGITMVRTPVSRERVRKAVADLYTGRKRTGISDTQRRALVWLRSVLVPAGSVLGEGTRLVIVPDSALAAVPFAALLDAPSGQFLIEAHAIEVSPSATLFEACRERERAMGAVRSPRALVFGDTRGSSASSLPALPGAHNELRAIAQTLNASPVIDGQATRAAFLRAAPGADIIYLAGHAVAGATPARRALVIAGDLREGDGRLSTVEIRANRFRGRLVVLAACDTGVVQGEGVTSLVRAFLVAGVPAVVGSLVAVEDGATEELLTPLARQLMAGRSASEALREVQLQSLVRDRNVDPFHWAGFQLYGSGTLPVRKAG
ncbi:MAG TPA: CHAT domain-containing protein [Thermoanaerobaculia bacterium]|jgi:CHAT domain-containing protein|nr:CHAT domain-containing protein [Thermoanaerobaculia bacterium]